MVLHTVFAIYFLSFLDAVNIGDVLDNVFLSFLSLSLFLLFLCCIFTKYGNWLQYIRLLFVCQTKYKLVYVSNSEIMKTSEKTCLAPAVDDDDDDEKSKKRVVCACVRKDAAFLSKRLRFCVLLR